MLSKMKEAPSFAERPIFHVTTDVHPKQADWDEEWMLYHRPDVRVDYGDGAKNASRLDDERRRNGVVGVYRVQRRTWNTD